MPAADTATVGELYQIHVLPTHWGQGIGSQLHATFVHYLHEAALPIGQVEAWDRNHRAQACYLRHGWRPTGTPTPGTRPLQRVGEADRLVVGVVGPRRDQAGGSRAAGAATHSHARALGQYSHFDQEATETTIPPAASNTRCRP
ncbi:GNAT family N-acetyltransferase [Streptomyces sp. N2A]|uniref:GNAT family N-acetyltransferase n=1 Tax=Streptomyces sp. N2A TaxID=3073936 RepID=UPI00286FC755|nr:GNAT family N-acetyltransferase [Streptomyces sp. N2A]